MKKIVTSTFLVLLFLSFSVASSSAEIASDPDLATYLGDITVYCRHWNNSIGKEYGTDITFNSDRMTIIKTMAEGISEGTMDLIVADYDGIIAELDWQLNVYSLRANATSDKTDSIYSMSRICALISTIAYDFPKSERQMTDRFLDVLNLYMDFLGKNMDEIFAKNVKTMTVRTLKGTFDFDFICMDDGIYVSWGTVNYPQNIKTDE